MNNIIEIVNNLIGVIGALSSIMTYLYFSNEKVYIFIQKLKSKIFKVTYPVLLKGDFLLKSELDIKKINDILFNEFNMRGNYIETGKKDNYFKFKIKIYKSPYNENILLISFKERTFVSLIQDNIRTIREIINNISSKTHSKLDKTDFIVEFLEKNPYEGFFIKRLPFEKIKDFSIKLEINKNHIEAKKDKIIIHSNELEKAFYTLEDIVSFKIPVLKA